MRKDIKEWVAALRSGEWEQCRRTLSDGAGYCCLGVYARLNGIDFIVHRGSDTSPNAKAYQKIDRRLRAALGGDFDYYTVADLNDAGATFAEIADEIERCYGK